MCDELELKSFVTNFSRCLNDENRFEDRLNSFFTIFRELYEEQIAFDSKLPVISEISSDDFQLFISKIKTPIREHYAHGFDVNVWDVAGVKHDEVRNSSILSWLLDCNGSHGQGSVFLEGLLSWLANNKSVPQQARENLPSPGSTHGVQYWTRAESLPLGEKESRVDIEISGPFVMIIEVKIYAAETGDQLRRYINIAEKKAIHRKWGVLFLTKYGSPPNDKSLSNLICTISWKQMASVINEVTNKSLPKGSFIEHQVKQFCNHIKSF